MYRSTVTKLALAVFGLTLVAFVVRGFGQFLVGPRAALMLAGPIAVAAAGLLVVVVGLWLLSTLGVVTLIDADGER